MRGGIRSLPNALRPDFRTRLLQQLISAAKSNELRAKNRDGSAGDALLPTQWGCILGNAAVKPFGTTPSDLTYDPYGSCPLPSGIRIVSRSNPYAGSFAQFEYLPSDYDRFRTIQRIDRLQHRVSMAAVAPTDFVVRAPPQGLKNAPAFTEFRYSIQPFEANHEVRKLDQELQRSRQIAGPFYNANNMHASRTTQLAMKGRLREALTQLASAFSRDWPKGFLQVFEDQSGNVVASFHRASAILEGDLTAYMARVASSTTVSWISVVASFRLVKDPTQWGIVDSESGTVFYVFWPPWIRRRFFGSIPATKGSGAAEAVDLASDASCSDDEDDDEDGDGENGGKDGRKDQNNGQMSDSDKDGLSKVEGEGADEDNGYVMMIGSEVDPSGIGYTELGGDVSKDFSSDEVMSSKMGGAGRLSFTNVVLKKDIVITRIERRSTSSVEIGMESSHPWGEGFVSGSNSQSLSKSSEENLKSGAEPSQSSQHTTNNSSREVSNPNSGRSIRNATVAETNATTDKANDSSLSLDDVRHSSRNAEGQRRSTENNTTGMLGNSRDDSNNESDSMTESNSNIISSRDNSAGKAVLLEAPPTHDASMNGISSSIAQSVTNDDSSNSHSNGMNKGVEDSHEASNSYNNDDYETSALSSTGGNDRSKAAPVLASFDEVGDTEDQAEGKGGGEGGDYEEEFEEEEVFEEKEEE
eukprot:CAMPEP_0175039474 /NCGR_PEP_ID=MMETSP0052_2-20121109/607_1 /TAXON_ID=51329 ORGANISM="Polytomella parva, Strain SAG 63-3" /NCGR_SAMPLE_ID=MMETSP0052_2 /ASSEMBLY_ACC=CAM_ASM_000194 /LENGTH=696 /DNA_ID=CAMNT_0016301337 /DNA_START=575 /DNA_END=2662 /DNA_ORIENTATION=-